MIKRQVKFESFDGKKIHLVNWNPDGEVRGVVQLVHGLAEHVARYQDFAEVMCANGYAVYGHDQRGHGKSLSDEDVVGHFADQGGWEFLMKDISKINNLISTEHPSAPIFVLGHSMGAIITSYFRELYDNDNIKGYLLSSLPFEQGALSSLGIGVGKFQALFKGNISQAVIHNYLSFETFNKAFKPNRTACDWLSRDETSVDLYVADPKCGQLSTVQLYQDMLFGLKEIYKEENLQKIAFEKPVFFFAGTDDPVSGGVKKFNETKGKLVRYTKDLETKLYEGGRHEMFHEINRNDVFLDVLAWLNRKNK